MNLKLLGKTFKFLSFYILPSQNKDEFETFLEKLWTKFWSYDWKNLFMMVALNFNNAKLKSWCTNDSRNLEGTKSDI